MRHVQSDFDHDPLAAISSRLIEMLEAPRQRLAEYRAALRDALKRRRIVLLLALEAQSLTDDTAHRGVCPRSSANIGAELARVRFAERQIPFLDLTATIYMLGVFRIDGRPGDYIATGDTCGHGPDEAVA